MTEEEKIEELRNLVNEKFSEEEKIEIFINLAIDKFNLLPYQIACLRYILNNKQKFEIQENTEWKNY